MHDPDNDLFDANTANGRPARSNLKQKDSKISLRERTRIEMLLWEGSDRQAKDFMQCQVVLQRHLLVTSSPTVPIEFYCTKQLPFKVPLRSVSLAVAVVKTVASVYCSPHIRFISPVGADAEGDQKHGDACTLFVEKHFSWNRKGGAIRGYEI